MRRLINIDFNNLVYRMLPNHKRQPKRLMLFSWPFALLQELFFDFKEWRKDVFYRVNVTGQCMSLQEYLNRKIESSNNAIRVESFNDNGVWVQLSTEPGESFMVTSDGIDVALEGEFTPLTDVDFYVYVPEGVNTSDVARIVNEYKLAGKRYLIYQFN